MKRKNRPSSGKWRALYLPARRVWLIMDIAVEQSTSVLACEADMSKELHDRATRGERLSVEEQKQLENWYAAQDMAESALLGSTQHEKTVANLQAQINAALVQLATVTQRLQETVVENESLRREIVAMRHQLAQLYALQPA